MGATISHLLYKDDIKLNVKSIQDFDLLILMTSIESMDI